MNIFNLYEFDDNVKYAFDVVCFNKMLVDGYCDMGAFINSSYNKIDMKNSLKEINSKYFVLYDRAFPKTPEEASFIWDSLFG